MKSDFARVLANLVEQGRVKPDVVASIHSQFPKKWLELSLKIKKIGDSTASADLKQFKKINQEELKNGNFYLYFIGFKN